MSCYQLKRAKQTSSSFLPLELSSENNDAFEQSSRQSSSSAKTCSPPPPLYTHHLCSYVFSLYGDRWFYNWRNSECLPWTFGVTICHDPIPVQLLLLLAGGYLEGQNTQESSNDHNRNFAIHSSQSRGVQFKRLQVCICEVCQLSNKSDFSID